MPFKVLIVGLMNQLRGSFRGKFDYIVLLCSTFAHNRTFDGFVDNEPDIFVIDCPQNGFEVWLKGRTRSSFWTTAPRRKT